MTKVTSDFGAQVKELRERLQLTQEAMAETLGVSFATVNRWENGWTAPSKLALRQIDLLCKERRIAPLTLAKDRRVEAHPRACDWNSFRFKHQVSWR